MHISSHCEVQKKLVNRNCCKKVTKSSNKGTNRYIHAIFIFYLFRFCSFILSLCLIQDVSEKVLLCLLRKDTTLGYICIFSESNFEWWEIYTLFYLRSKLMCSCCSVKSIKEQSDYCGGWTEAFSSPEPAGLLATSPGSIFLNYAKSNTFTGNTLKYTQLDNTGPCRCTDVYIYMLSENTIRKSFSNEPILCTKIQTNREAEPPTQTPTQFQLLNRFGQSMGCSTFYKFCSELIFWWYGQFNTTV